jgi:hypothetical protein
MKNWNVGRMEEWKNEIHLLTQLSTIPMFQRPRINFITGRIKMAKDEVFGICEGRQAKQAEWR